MIEVLAPGLLSSLQDAGRPGYAQLGIGRAGAADLPAMRLANALVGNPPEACVLEFTLLGPCLRLARAARVALTGAPLPRARCNDVPLPMWQARSCPAGSVLDFGPMASGCRSYLAIDGGLAVAPWLGSRSTDLNAGVGPLDGRALRVGDRLPLGDALPSRAHVPRWSLDPRPWFDVGSPLRLLPASHTDQLDEASRAALTREAFALRADSNRVGARLQGPTLRLRRPLELVSEGVVAGVMQLPPDGQPIVLLNEHPVTGGYPRIAQLAAADLPALAQRRPGDMLQFRWTTLAEARQAYAQQQQWLAELLGRVAQRLNEDT
ncbi:MAG TPA: biotin-dependent carboxyltransferase family protein [Frateuria sp.]|uniref:5-oxoprolinase subunit C family protein n=1 Tax=Frateuria sp. TaxID=2211372 RepID=UPI002D80BDC9|nr:biotin-dependent carboxyltransferase family protein [Frateuria sp.]HET6806531.1 biotin-dependent carboxyltransferase family protein [Frateuria sp.]